MKPVKPVRLCNTCGAGPSERATNGRITMFHGWPTCALCKEGAQALLDDEPETWEIGADGRLRRKTPHPQAEAWKAAVDRMHTALTALPYGHQVRVERFHPSAGVAVIMGGGYRWHVYLPGRGLLPSPDFVAMLFSPTIMMVDGAPVFAMEHITAMVDLVAQSMTPGTPVADAIDRHRLQA